MDLERFDRNVRLFGREGQERLRQVRVAVIGLGGLGSHVVQQLCYAGVRGLRLLDGEPVTISNLNRLVGARLEDARLGRRKVEVAERLVRDIEPDADVRVAGESFISEAGLDLMRSSDVVFGCLDDDAARVVLNEFCQAFEVPYFDLATDVDRDTEGRLTFGGRVLFSTAGEMCVQCKELLDPEEVAAAFMTDGQQREWESVYGVPRRALGQRSPSVVSLNGLVASAAVTEFLCEATGLRPAARLLVYHGMRGILAKDVDAPAPDCYYCKGLRGRREGADWFRYVREGWGERLAARRATENESGRHAGR
jgi:hypothetical protein